MAERGQILATIDALYASRVSGDVAQLGTLLTEGATYQMVNTTPLLAGMPAGPVDALFAIEMLTAKFTFHSVERRSAIVEGNRACVHLVVSVSDQSGDRWETHLCDWWEFDDEGKGRSIVQFTDTATLAAKL